MELTNLQILNLSEGLVILQNSVPAEDRNTYETATSIKIVQNLLVLEKSIKNYLITKNDQVGSEAELAQLEKEVENGSSEAITKKDEILNKLNPLNNALVDVEGLQTFSFSEIEKLPNLSPMLIIFLFPILTK